MSTDDIPCPECAGTGHTEPECEICHGYGDVTYRQARAKGIKPWELQGQDLEIDDPDDPLGSAYFKCPRCDSETCAFCCGEGRADAGFDRRQIDRVLLTAADGTGRIYGAFPDITEDRKGRIEIDYDQYLSLRAGSVCQENGWIRWYVTVFGDELSLTYSGEREVSKFFDDGTGRFLQCQPWEMPGSGLVSDPVLNHWWAA